ncbi:putative secreted protein [Penicillium rolfsii]|nr:putative secreted protein [Penicillium rolfsii]
MGLRTTHGSRLKVQQLYLCDLARDRGVLASEMHPNFSSVAVRLLLLWCGLAPVSCIEQAGTSRKLVPDSTLHQSPLRPALPEVVLSDTWEVLGPFRVGTREAIWGADPLGYYGGFHNLSYDSNATFSSALAMNGSVQWATTYATILKSSYGQVQAALNVEFPAVNWAFMQSVYGWSALQYQAWARGLLEIKGSQPQTVAIFGDGLLEFLVDGEPHFGGDMFQYHRVPSLIELTPGPHVLELRLTRDVRAQGGLSNAIEVTIHAELRGAEPITLVQNSLLVAELANGRIASPWASINVQNNGEDLVEIKSVRALQVGSSVHLAIICPYNPAYAPFQSRLRITRHLIFNISLAAAYEPQFSVEVAYQTADRSLRALNFNINLEQRPLSDPLRITYLHPAGIVSYAILRAPPPKSCDISIAAPVILVLHGAGLEADSAQARGMLDGVYGTCAWMLFPSGVTSWSGDDWHYWGVADIQAAVSAIADWIIQISWDGPAAAIDELIVVGHSNGGQGAWHFSTHFPDNVSAVAPVSAYTSIENYVPYTMWHNLEPSLSSILDRSRSAYKHESLVGNLAGIQVAQQHGAADDNVPAYHGRLMHELLDQAQWPAEYEELPGKGHWYEGVMTTEYLKIFYQTMVSRSRTARELPQTFTITVPASGTLGSKAGIQVDQLYTPDVSGKIRVTRSLENKAWHITTRNIRRFHLSEAFPRVELPETVVLDDMSGSFDVDYAPESQTWFVRDTEGKWYMSRDTRWKTVHQRYGRQLGALDAILRTHGTFTIRRCSPGVEDVALQISRNLFQYFAADSHIIDSCSNNSAQHQPGNVITLAVSDDLPPAPMEHYPIQVDQGRLEILTGRASSVLPALRQEHKYGEPGLGAVFLRPCSGERLELVVWGTDLNGLRQAARLVPTITGSGQPEYVVLGDSSRWEGVAGIYAAGHFDWSWQISPSSYHSDPI